MYPPLNAAMCKLFSEQETERVKLAAAHLAEQVIIKRVVDIIHIHVTCWADSNLSKVTINTTAASTAVMY